MKIKKKNRYDIFTYIYIYYWRKYSAKTRKIALKIENARVKKKKINSDKKYFMFGVFGA